MGNDTGRVGAATGAASEGTMRFTASRRAEGTSTTALFDMLERRLTDLEASLAEQVVTRRVTVVDDNGQERLRLEADAIRVRGPDGVERFTVLTKDDLVEVLLLSASEDSTLMLHAGVEDGATEVQIAGWVGGIEVTGGTEFSFGCKRRYSEALERDLATIEGRLDRLTRAVDLSNAAGKDRIDELEETFLAAQRASDLAELRRIAQEAVAAAVKCVEVVEAYGKATAKEVVTRRLRVVDEHGRTWVEASDGGVRCAAPDDPGTWVGMSVDVDPYNGRLAGLWLSRRGNMAGSFTTERDAEVLDPSDPAATFDIYTAGGPLCERESMPAGSLGADGQPLEVRDAQTRQVL